MNDYISRQAAIAAIHELKMSVSGYDNDALDVSLIYEVLGEIPAADVQPIKRGRWFLRGGNWCCSACNRKHSESSQKSEFRADQKHRKRNEPENDVREQ